MLSRINFRVIQEYVGKKLREGSVHIYGNCGNGTHTNHSERIELSPGYRLGG